MASWGGRGEEIVNEIVHMNFGGKHTFFLLLLSGVEMRQALFYRDGNNGVQFQFLLLFGYIGY